LKYSLIDVSNLIYQVYFANYKAYNPNIHINPVPFLYDKLVALVTPAIKPGYKPVFLFDKKRDGCYWRQNFIDDRAKFYSELWEQVSSSESVDQKYKGGRLKASDYNPILDYTREASELLKKQLYFEEPGLEADDLAGLLCKYRPKDCYLDLVTVDWDWAGLLELNNNKIRFIDLYYRRRYKVHKADDVVDYFKSKLCKEVESPDQAYYWKQKLGEKGDNLLAGCDIELIDLKNYSAPLDYGFESAHQLVKDFYNNELN
jgi:hypothetical protein